MKRILIFCLSAIISSLFTSVYAQTMEKPNFIIIMADDLGYGDLGIYGSKLIKTPNLDQMAQQGALLNSFYSSANVCTAARGGLLTGKASS